MGSKATTVGHRLHDSRLLGTWRSDKRRTAREIEARKDIPRKKLPKLLSIFGKLTLRYTRTRCYSTFGGATEVLPYRVVAKDAQGVVVVGSAPLAAGQESIFHIHFEEPHYWVCLGAFREYFKRVGSRPTTG